MTDTIPAKTCLSFILLAFGVACSVVPSKTFPPHRDLEVLVRYQFHDGNPAPIEVPASNGRLTVLQLETSVAAHEAFCDGHRMLTAPAGTDELQVRCRYRIWAHELPGGLVYPTPRELFPNATELKLLSGQF